MDVSKGHLPGCGGLTGQGLGSWGCRVASVSCPMSDVNTASSSISKGREEIRQSTPPPGTLLIVLLLINDEGNLTVSTV